DGIRDFHVTGVQTCALPISKEDLKNLIDNTGLTDSEIAEGLKSALIVGTDTSTSLLSKTDGYYADLAVKILLPAEVSARIEDFRSEERRVGKECRSRGEQ